MPMRSSETWTWTPLTPPPLPKAPDTYVYAIDLPIGHKQVLLKLRRGELAAKIFAHLREQGIPEPTKSDWVAAIARGHVVRIKGRLGLAPPGLWAAGDIMRDLARKFDIHHINSGGGISSGYWARCTCGHWGGTTAKTDSARNALMRSGEMHLQKVNAEAGT